MHDARAQVRDAPCHLGSLTTELHPWNLIGVHIVTSVAQRISKSEDSSRARALNVHNSTCIMHPITKWDVPSNYTH